MRGHIEIFIDRYRSKRRDTEPTIEDWNADEWAVGDNPRGIAS